jgi:soluble lytic murein transglycosylase-like protein
MIDMPMHHSVTPVTESCLVIAAQTYQVPLAILAGVMAQEGGKVGASSLNGNGTHDYGPMQINTVWLNGLQKQGITVSSVKNNGCLNLYVGAAILKKHMTETKGNVWEAVGHYHSKTPKHRDKYLYRVAKKVKKIISGEITLASILRKANNS